MTQPDPSPPVQQAGKTSPLLSVLGGLFIACFFLFFTWRVLLLYYSGDDMMNLYIYWSKPVSALVKGNLFFWTPFYRPFGGIIYRTFFAIFGFNPRPVYILYYAAMLVNLWLAYLVFTKISESREVAAIATLLYCFHGKFDYLYYNAGSMYDVFCFLFSFLTLLIYLRARLEGRLLGVWETLGFLLCFVCALNSKEMAITLPIMIFIYELLFHPPDFRSLRALIGWCFREGRMALVGAVCVLIYLPAKLGSQGLTADPAYVPRYTWARWLADTGTYLADLLYRNSPTGDLGVAPLTLLGVAGFYGALIVIALWVRSRAAWFGLIFFVIVQLPVSFIPARLGFVLYLPLAGLALYAAVCLVHFKAGLSRMVSEALGNRATAGAASPTSASIALFLATAVVIAVVDYRNWPRAQDPRFSPYRNTVADFSRLYPSLSHGSKLLFLHTSLDDTYDLVFVLRLYYRDPDIFITELNGPPAQRIPLNRLPNYDHIFDFEDGHYIELENGDTLESIQLHIPKTAGHSDAFGEVMSVGRPGASRYFVKGVLTGDAKAEAYWTLDEPELQFQLSTVQHHMFREHFYIPPTTFRKTGPLMVDFYVNGHLLDQAVFAKDGDVVYEHDVPVDWLKTDSLTTVRMRVRNPYVAPHDGARLGVLLRSAYFAR